ncbi:MAG: T9SS type A sorting domain-containing protein, partial [Bacteroidetes bacterium]|nr:T9SS type A sorting domain-containing protein [Bacteroidota bacterium]
LTAPSGTINIAGTYSNSGTFTPNGGTVDFNGGAQSLGGTGSAGTDFYNLTISGTLTKTLTKPVTVAGNLTLTSGFLATDATNILTIAAGGTTSGVSSSSFVNGPMAKAGNTAFDFPVGAGTKLGRIGISAPSTTTTFTAQYFNAAPSNSTSFGSGLNGGAGKISAVEYWNLTPTGTPSANVVLHWESNTSGITSLLAANLVVAHYTGSAWVSEGNAGTTVSGAAGTLTSNTISTWSPFTFGSPSGFAPLPVKLISFTAKAIEKDAILNWSTATERNNDHFELERSNDGVIFTKIGEVNGAGNSTSIVKYAFTDARVADMSSQNVYYRLKQVDFDGSFEYSNLAIVTFAKQGVVSISNVQPNPFAGNLVVNYNLPDQGNVTIRIIDAQGRIVASNEVNANKGSNTAAFNTTDYAKGIYFISINYNGSSTNYKMLVKE